MRIRTCTATDVGRICQLLGQLWPDIDVNTAEMQRCFERGLQSPNHRYICAVLDDEVVGFCSLNITDSATTAAVAMNIAITEFSMTDYEEAVALWSAMPEIGLDDADTPERMESFLVRNPGLSFVARDRGTLVGAVLCGHDGRRGYLHHLAVDRAYRGAGIGSALVDKCLSALAAAGIQRCNIFVFTENEEGKGFWEKTGWPTYEGLRLMYKNAEQES